MLADGARDSTLKEAARRAVKSLVLQPHKRHAGILVLDLSDGPLMGLMVFCSLLYHLRSRVRRRTDPASRRLRQILRLAGRRPMVLNLENSEEDSEIASDLVEAALPSSCRPSYSVRPVFKTFVGSPRLAPQSVAMVCAEPYARQCEGAPCDAQMWQHWSQIDSLRWALRSSVVLLPRKFCVKAVLISCQELWRRRQPVSGPICGIDVSAVNTLHPEVGQDSPFRDRFPCGLWQVAHSIIGEAVTLCAIDLNEDFPQVPRDFPQVHMTCPDSSAAVSGLATWTEQDVGLNVTPMSTASFRHTAVGSRHFAPGPWLQGVMLARQPRVAPSSAAKVGIRARFDPGNGSLLLQGAWSDTGLVF